MSSQNNNNNNKLLISKSPMQNTIALYENQSLMNKYDTKEDFFKLYDQLKKRINDKQLELKHLLENEVHRIIKEFDLKSYASKYKTDSETVLCALFGAFQAEREIIRNGLKKK